ncbi:MAG: ferrous iron transport protein A [Anaerolineales bacterium]|nr:ferrous iron transport protein A [Anaerolineales bacterium]
MNLVDVEKVIPVKVLGVDRGQGALRNLASLGVHPGDYVTVIRRAPFRGPILVRVESTGVNLAIGREMAKRILIEAEISQKVS